MDKDKNIIKVQEEFIYLLLHYKKCANDFMESNLSIEHFDDKYKFLLNCVVDCYESDTLLTRYTYLEKLKIFNSPKDRIINEQIFGECYLAKTEIDNYLVLSNKVIDYNIEKSIQNGLKKFGEQKSKDRILAVNNLIDDFQNILYSNSPVREKLYYDDVRSLSDENIQYIKDVRDGKIEEKKRILCGIKEIDDTMITGFEKGTLTLFCADVGHYKSTMMMNIAMNIWESGHPVLFVPLEMDKHQIWRRMISRDSKISCESIIKDLKNLTAEQVSKIEDTQKKWSERKSKFFLMQEPERTTVKNIQRLIERNINIFKPELVVIDYVANLEAHVNRYGRNDLEIGDMLKEMRHMGKSMGFATISGAQLGREFLKKLRKAGANRDKATVHSEDIRGSHEYAADADNIYAQIKSVSQPNELLDFFCVKARNGKTTFADGGIRTTLYVNPQIYLIRSQVDNFADVDDILDDFEKIEQEDILNEKKENKEVSNFSDEDWV